MTAGAIGGLMFWGPWVTQKAEFPTKFSQIYPIDMIKSVMQGDTPIRAQRTYKTMYGTFRHILKHQGPRAFFRGFVPCFLRAAPVNAATFLGFEMTHKYLNKMGL